VSVAGPGEVRGDGAAGACALGGKAVVITGAGRGLGRAYALDAARSGAALVVNDLDGEPLEEAVAELGQITDRIVPVPGSVADWWIAESLVRECVEAFGALDGFVANAGVHHCAYIWEESEADVRRAAEVNVTGAAFCAIHALRQMKEQGSGSLVNITSGAHIGMPEMSTYGATKGAVASATYAWAIDMRPYGVRVNAVSPVALTRMTDNWKAPGSELSRAGSPPPETIAPVVTYLLSDAAAGITGQVVRMDKDGLSLMRPPGFANAVVPLAERTVEAVRGAFDAGLGAELEHVGLGHWT